MHTRARQASSYAFPEYSSSLQQLTAQEYPEPDTPSRHSIRQSGSLPRTGLWIHESCDSGGKVAQGECSAVQQTTSPRGSCHSCTAVTQQHPQTLLLLYRTSLSAPQRPNPRGCRQVLCVALFLYLFEVQSCPQYHCTISKHPISQVLSVDSLLEKRAHQ